MSVIELFEPIIEMRSLFRTIQKNFAELADLVLYTDCASPTRVQTVFISLLMGFNQRIALPIYQTYTDFFIVNWIPASYVVLCQYGWRFYHNKNYIKTVHTAMKYNFI